MAALDLSGGAATFLVVGQHQHCLRKSAHIPKQYAHEGMAAQQPAASSSSFSFSSSIRSISNESCRRPLRTTNNVAQSIDERDIVSQCDEWNELWRCQNQRSERDVFQRRAHPAVELPLLRPVCLQPRVGHPAAPPRPAPALDFGTTRFFRILGLEKQCSI